MTVFESNIKFLSKQYPALLNVIDNDTLRSECCESLFTRNDEPNLRILLNNNAYYLHSRYSAREEAQKWVQSIQTELSQVKHLFIMGVGLGYYLEELLLICKSKDIFVLEPNVDVFNEWLKTKDVTSVLSNSQIRVFAVGENDNLPWQIANEISEIITDNFLCVSPPIYKKLYPKMLEQFDMRMKEMIIQEISNMQTREVYESAWLTNILYNFQHIIMNPSILELRDLWKNKDVKAIVVGSGPSLGKDIHYLSQLKDKCLIIAAGSSIQALEHHGVYPHFVVSMDGSDANYSVFKNTDTSQVPLVFCPPVYYEIPENYNNNIFYARFQNDPVTKYILDPNDQFPIFISTATVTGTAIQMASFMGITDILLMGQDLSFTEDQFYAPGVRHVSEENQRAHISHAEQWVENVEGGRNRTKGSMEVLLRDVELLVQIMGTRGVNIVNTSKKGAVIKGTEWMSMDELAPQLLKSYSREFDITNYISSVSVTTQLEKLGKTITQLQVVLNDTNTISTEINKMSGYMSKLDKALSIRNNSKVYSEIIEINEIWTSITSKEIFNVFYSYSLAHYINIYMRYVNEIVETKNSFKKAELIISHLGSLVNKMKLFTPHLQDIVKSSIIRLENVQIYLETPLDIKNQ